MKRSIFLLLFSLILSCAYAHNYNSYLVNKQVKDYPEDSDFSTPLKAFVSFQYLWAKGKNSDAHKKSSFRIRQRFPDESPDKEVTAEEQYMLLNTEIKEVITYYDSVAAVITLSPDSIYRCYYLNLEQNSWVNGGSDRSTGVETAKNQIRKILPLRLLMLQRTNIVLNTPTDTIAFTTYLKENGKAPVEFLLETLAEHKLVIYGERHRRKQSWQLLKDLINDPIFRRTTGTIFMELQSYKQNEIDQFFRNTDRMDSSVLIRIYQDMQAPGLYDKGGFEFLITLWELNKRLPEQEKIKVVFTDYQPPFEKIRTKEEFQDYRKNARKRNTHMADIIEQTIKKSLDLRNNLFIVGYAHAYKSPAIERYGDSPEDDCSAANQLVTRFSDQDIFCIRVHTSGIIGYTRGGMFDHVFAENGASPVAFRLKGSPFGREIIENWAFEKDDFGSFENNYDGYIYLGGEPVDKHPEYRLTDIYTEDFVQEIIRRTYLLEMENAEWFGVPNKSLTLECLLKDLNDL